MKTLQECKDEVARKYGYKSFKEIEWYLTRVWTEKGWETYMGYFDEVTQLYAQCKVEETNAESRTRIARLIGQIEDLQSGKA